MTTKITPEAVKERIAALESAGELSLKEQFYLEALRQLVAAMGSEPDCKERKLFCSTDTTRMRKTIHVSAGTGDAPLYRHAQPVPVAYSDFESFWSSYIHPLAQDDELKGFAWDIWCAAMLKAGNSPVIPDGSTDMLRRWLSFGRGMQSAGSQLPRNLITETEGMLAATPQPQNAQQNIPEIIPDSCTWTFSNYDDHWSGTCGAEWVFNDGGPEENGVKFCPKCGKSVAVSATEGTEE